MADCIGLATSLSWDFSQYSVADILERLPISLVAFMILDRHARMAPGDFESKKDAAAGAALRERLIKGIADGN